MTRQEANKQILELIQRYLNMHPDCTFHQALQNLNIVNPEDENERWFEESEKTLEKAYQLA